jgi:hypothetical protein
MDRMGLSMIMDQETAERYRAQVHTAGLQELHVRMLD